MKLSAIRLRKVSERKEKMNLKKILRDPVGGKIITAFTMYIFSTALPSLINDIFSNRGVSDLYQFMNKWFMTYIGVSLNSLYYLLLTLFFFGFVGFVLVKSLLSISPIKWSFDDFLFIEGYNMESNPGWLIKSFEATGVNRTKKPISNIKGYLESDYTGERFEMKFTNNGELKDIKSLIAIPPGERLNITVPFRQKSINDYAEWKGLSPSRFLDRYVPFKFVCEIEGKIYEYKFSEKKIKNKLFSIIYKRRYKKGGPIFRS